MTTSYISPDEAQEYVGTQSGQSLTLLTETVEAVSRNIDGYCGRHFYQVTETRSFEVTCLPFDLGPFNDLVSATTVTVDSNNDHTPETALTGYRLGPVNRSGPEPLPYYTVTHDSGFVLGGTISIAGVWGWPSVPAAVKQACRLQTARVFKRVESPLGVAGFGEFGVVRLSALDPDVRALLDPYRYQLWFG